MSIEKIIERMREDARKQSEYIAKAWPGDDYNSRLMRSLHGVRNNKQNEGRKNG